VTAGKSIDWVVETAIKRDRIIVLCALSGVVALSWAYLLAGAGMDMAALVMTQVDAGGVSLPMMMPAEWDAGYASLMFVMWWVMMVAMMLPSAAPMMLLFAAMNRKQREKENPCPSTLVFIGAYLFIWAGFSVAAVCAQWGLESTALLSPMLESSSVVLGGSLLIAAGIYQMTPLKQVCLDHCRSPLQFILTRWRSGNYGAFRMGIEHGVYCVGCCWFLMSLLFFGGVMNLYWIAGLAGLVLFEKTILAGRWITRLVGIFLVVWGIAVLGELVA